VIVTIPAVNGTRLPTLGPAVVAWLEANTVHGPGDVRGQPLRVPDLWRAVLGRAYEVYPRGHTRAGRRRWKRVVVEMPKGLAKTEMAGLVAIAEAHPEAPVRTVGWRGDRPVGAGVVDPYIPMVAFTEEQSEDLAYGVLYAVLTTDGCPAGAAFNPGVEETTRIDGSGKVKPLAGSPSAREGARTTFQIFDETGRHTSPRLREAHKTMRQNPLKRAAADGWTLECSAMWEPGEESVAEISWRYATAVAEGTVTDPQMLYIALRAREDHDTSSPAGLRAALVEARGPATAWSDVDALAAEWGDPEADVGYLERVWLGWPRSSRTRWVQAPAWDGLAAAGELGDEPVVLGFDGARTRDATVLVAARLSDGWATVAGWWERPAGLPAGELWEVDDVDVDATVAEWVGSGRAVLMYGDPPYWREWLAAWQARWPDVVRPWETNRVRQMAYALFETRANLAGHDGDPRLRRHVLAADRRPVPVWIDDETQGYKLVKPPSGDHIDGAMAYVLAQEARRDARRRGLGVRRRPARAAGF
jgi:hypothetical protein